jgi:hypothetical protein
MSYSIFRSHKKESLAIDVNELKKAAGASATAAVGFLLDFCCVLSSTSTLIIYSAVAVKILE